jgi:hypothetical protein
MNLDPKTFQNLSLRSNKKQQINFEILQKGEQQSKKKGL